jgi:hypothetical protein
VAAIGATGRRRLRKRRLPADESFSPKSVPNLVRWLDAKDPKTLLATSGGSPAAVLGTVGQWLDKSGNGYHVSQATSGSRPWRDDHALCDRPAVVSDGTRFMTGGGISANTITVYTVWYTDTTTGQVYELTTNVTSAAGVALANDDAPTIAARGSTGNLSFKGANSASWSKLVGPMLTRHMSLGTHATHTLQQNGADVSASTYGGASANPGTGNWTSTGDFLLEYHDGSKKIIGGICEQAVYSGVLTDAQHTRLLAYFRRRWRIAAPGQSATRKLVAVGDQLTAGSPGDASHTYPARLGPFAGSQYGSSVTNINSSNLTVAGAISAAATVDAQYSVAKEQNVLFVWLGRADVEAGTAAATVYASLTSYIQARQAVGWQVVLLPVIPSEWTSTYAAKEAIRVALNALIDANSAGADAVVPLTSDAVFGVEASRNDTVWYNADKIRLTNRGYLRIANRCLGSLTTLPIGQAGSSLIFEVNFAALDVGEQTTLPNGLQFTRASVRTGQTSASEFVTGVSVDHACVVQHGDDNTRGLSIEESTTNAAQYNRTVSNATSGGFYFNNHATINQANSIVSPDGSTIAYEYNVASADFGVTTGNPIVTPGARTSYSSWFRAISGTSNYQFGALGGTGWTSFQSLNCSTTWQRRWQTVVPSGVSMLCSLCDGRALTVSSVDAAIACAMDMVQIERLGGPTSGVINTSTPTTRTGERLFLADGSALIAGGRMCLAVRFIIPPGWDLNGTTNAYADSPVTTQLTIVEAANGDGIVVDVATREINVVINGNTYTAHALDASEDDVVDIFVAAGGGSDLTVVKSRVEAGSVTTSTSGAAQDSWDPNAGEYSIYSNGSAEQQLTAIHQLLQAYDHDAPAWAA